MHGPHPDEKHPMKGFPQVCFIRNTIGNPNIVVGEYTYYDDPEVVTRDVPAYTVVGGNPAVPIRKRFPEEAIEKLQAVAWWNWPIEKITRHLHLIVGGDVEALAALA